ncbi:MAG: DUF2147 domain-containing protein [Bacteroidales bacterium]|nr:DUF2147 domain-containing protein [Bacteroidales bacterium]
MYSSIKKYAAMNEVGIIIMILLVMVLVTINSRAGNPTKQSNSEAADIFGFYIIPNGLIIELYADGNYVSGRISNTDDYSDSKDVNNPDKKERDQPLLGKRIVSGLAYNTKTKEWAGGQMYAPDKGITVDLKILSVHTDHLMAEGSKFLFSKKLRWEKMTPSEKE